MILLSKGNMGFRITKLLKLSCRDNKNNSKIKPLYHFEQKRINKISKQRKADIK